MTRSQDLTRIIKLTSDRRYGVKKKQEGWWRNRFEMWARPSYYAIPLSRVSSTELSSGFSIKINIKSPHRLGYIRISQKKLSLFMYICRRNHCPNNAILTCFSHVDCRLIVIVTDNTLKNITFYLIPRFERTVHTFFPLPHVLWWTIRCRRWKWNTHKH